MKSTNREPSAAPARTIATVIAIDRVRAAAFSLPSGAEFSISTVVFTTPDPESRLAAIFFTRRWFRFASPARNQTRITAPNRTKHEKNSRNQVNMS